MPSFLQRFHQSVGARIAVVIFLLATLIFTLYAWALAYSSAEDVERRAVEFASEKSRSVVDMTTMFAHASASATARFARMLETVFPSQFSLEEGRAVEINGRKVAMLKNGDNDINLNFTIVDRFTAQSGVSATVFAKQGDDFVRVSTSVKKENGERAVGTVLDRAHPGYAPLMAGQRYAGLATLFGKQYMTQYDPVRNAAGQVVGVLYVGVDIDAEIAALKERIKAVKLGDTGYFYVLDAKPGKDFGRMLVHPSLEGKNVQDLKSADGRELFREILERKQGDVRYQWQDKEGEATREKFAAFAHEKGWNWVVVGSAYVDEMTREVKALRNRYALFGVAAVLVLVGLLYFFIRRAVTVPLAQATAAAQRLATGDLTATLQTDRSDEIGQLMQAMNGTGQGLTDVVRQVRTGAGQIAAASGEIATGNLDLSERTERQAGALRDTAAAMNQLTATVQQNSSDADQAQRLAASAADVAARGGVAVGEVVQTMEEISQASRRMADIISVIDGIAFQTNILALNAAVEAARAGEQGRGFAVVAGEVRVLAQRSAAAAHEIKALIDASTGKVEAGGVQVRRAGATMEEVVSGVQELSALMAGISQASRLQSEGIAKVDSMVSQMDDVTQQNAAMVEQAAAAAASLQEQAATLVGMVDTFKVA